MAEHVQSPRSIATGLAQFGGILAALRGLMIVMYWINRRQFEKKLSKFLQEEKSKADGLQESSSIVSRNRDGDINRRLLKIQDEESNFSDSLLD